MQLCMQLLTRPLSDTDQAATSTPTCTRKHKQFSCTFMDLLFTVCIATSPACSKSAPAGVARTATLATPLALQRLQFPLCCRMGSSCSPFCDAAHATPFVLRAGQLLRLLLYCSICNPLGVAGWAPLAVPVVLQHLQIPFVLLHLQFLLCCSMGSSLLWCRMGSWITTWTA